MTLEQLLSEVRNRLKTYDEAGLIDEISIANWMKECIKEFTGSVMSENTTTLIVERGRAKLPDNYWALKAAVKCEQEGYTEVPATKQAQRRISYLEWTDIGDYYNYLEGSPCKESGDTRYITETLFFEAPKKSYQFYYNQLKLLKLKNHINSIRCDANCPNITAQSDFEISIDGSSNYIHTNFNDGFIWLYYQGLPSDENGNLIIPELGRDKLKEYVLYTCLAKTLESLWLQEDEPNAVNKLSYLTQKANEYYYAAKQDIFGQHYNEWKNKVVNNNKKEMMKYDNLYRTIGF